MRLTCSPAGELVVGRTAPGRGAWVCGPACLERAARRQALAKALRRSPDPASIERVRRSLESTFVAE